MDFSFSSSFSDPTKTNESAQQKNICDVENENARLVKENLEISKQLANLRKQFDQALDVSTKIDNIYTTNTEYSKEIANLRAQKDDLSRRLQIALQNNQDLNNKLRNCTLNPSILSENVKTLEAQRSMLEKKNSEQQEKIKLLSNENERLKREDDDLKISLENVYQAASHFFDIPISSPATLLECFLRKTKTDESKYLKKIARQVDRLKKELREKEIIIETYEKNHLQTNANQAEADIKIAEINAILKDYQEKNSQQAHEIEDLTRRNLSLSEEIQQKNAQIRISTFTADEKQCQENQQLKSQLISTQSILETVSKKNKQLKSKLFVMVCKAKSLEKKCKTLTNTISALETKKAELKNEIQKNDSLHTQAKFKIKDVEMTVMRAQDELNIQKKENEKVHEELFQVQNRLKQSEHEYKELRNERDNLLMASQQFDGKIQAYEAKIQNYQVQQETLEKKLQEVMNPLDCPSMFPPSLLNSHDFPNDLQIQLAEISRNPGINFALRIQNAFSSVAKYYKTKMDQIEAAMSDDIQKYNILKSQASSLVDYFNRLMPELKINFELILTDEQTRNILGDSIRKLKETQRLDPIIDEIDNLLGIQKLEDAKDEIEKLMFFIDMIQKKIKKEKELKKKLKKYIKSREKEIANMIQSLEATNTSLEQELNNEINKRHSLENTISELETQMKKQSDELISSSEKKIQELTNQITELKDQYKVVGGLKETISKLSRQKEKLENEIQIRKNQQEDAENQHKQRIKSEKEKNEQLMEQMRKQSIDMQTKMREVTDELSKSDAMNSVLTSNNNEMALRIQKLETRLNATQSEYERDKQAIESQNAAKLLYQETQFKSKIEEKQLQFNILQKRLIDSVSRTFSSYLDGIKVDESNLEGSLQILKRKIDAIINRENMIRSRFGLDSSVPLENIISALLSKRKKK